MAVRDLIVVGNIFEGNLDIDPSIFFCVPPMQPDLRGHLSMIFRVHFLCESSLSSYCWHAPSVFLFKPSLRPSHSHQILRPPLYSLPTLSLVVIRHHYGRRHNSRLSPMIEMHSTTGVEPMTIDVLITHSPVRNFTDTGTAQLGQLSTNNLPLT